MIDNSNLPPGVTEAMIPGNEPDWDIEWGVRWWSNGFVLQHKHLNEADARAAARRDRGTVVYREVGPWQEEYR